MSLLKANCACHPIQTGLFTRFSQSAAKDTDDKLLPHPHVRDDIADILNSVRLANSWRRAHITSDSNPFPTLGEYIKNIHDNLDQYPYLLHLMREIAHIEKGALGPKKKNEPQELKDLRQRIGEIETYLSSFPEMDFDEDDLPEEYRSVLNLMRHDTGQKPFEPIRASLRTAGHMASHAYEQVKTSPGTTAVFTGLAVALSYLMNVRLGMANVGSIPAEATTVMEIGEDTLMKLNEPLQAGQTTLTVDPGLLDLNAKICLHDHARIFMPDLWAQSLSEVLGGTMLMPHCSTVNRWMHYTNSAQEGLKSGVDWINQRVDIFVTNPSTDIGSRVLGNTKFFDTFRQTAQSTADFWKVFNNYENVIIHGPIMVGSFALAYNVAGWEKHEFMDAGRKITDFAYRTASKTPLNLILCTSASIPALMAGNTPAAVWLAVLGYLTGELTHKIINRYKAPDFAMDTALHVSKHDLVFENPNRIASDARASETSQGRERNLWDKLKYPAAGAAALMIATTADFKWNDGHITAKTLGVAVPTTLFGMYNTVEDLLLAHGMFGLVGAGLGATTRVARDQSRKLLKRTGKSRDDAGRNDPPAPLPPL